MNKIFASASPAVTQMELDHAKLVRALAGECMVLLENDGALPLAPSPVALYGNGAVQTVKGGTGSGSVNSREHVSIEDGLRRAGFTITTESWLTRNTLRYEQAKQAYAKDLPVRAKKLQSSEIFAMFSEPFQAPPPEAITEQDIVSSGTGTAIYVLSRNSGEGADRRCVKGDYLLFEEEEEQLRQLAQVYPRLILLLNIGGILDLNQIKAIPGINAILLMGQLGSAGGLALADVLSGKSSPSGKLTDTWAKSYQAYPASASFSRNDGNTDDEYYTEGIYVGYRYFDSFHIEPMYPFGYGLSYTAFDVRCTGVSVSRSAIRARVEITNCGKYPGKEVVQVYCSPPRGALPKPYQSLVGFGKTNELSPGQRQSLDICWDAANLASYHPDCAGWVLERGEYIVRIGTSSRDTKAAAVLTLDRDIKTAGLKNLFRDDAPIQELTAPVPAEERLPGVPRIALTPDEIPQRTTAYLSGHPVLTTDKARLLTARDVKTGACQLEELVAQLTIEELAAICVGTHRTQGGSLIGTASRLVPGAAGDSSAILWEGRGIKSMILADGPAGLRLQPVFRTDQQGRLLPGGSVIDDAIETFDPKYDDTNSDTWYQYCTAIPIGWSLAQAWNPELLEALGRVIGAEMTHFGVDLWLAPALNIHRDPLCGRNFEYYSEDPLVSGKTAAAITRGVQSHPGKGVTIKHLAANNQEENRYFSNSHVSERALREIYLKGFEIAVRESCPMSIMTSYNLLNGVHTANSFELLQSVCRDEWGFQGVIMTDWYTSQSAPSLTGNSTPRYPISASTGCVKAGNDLQMPGCQKNVDDLIAAVHSGRAIDGYAPTLGDLQFCAANVIRAALQTDV